MEQLEGKLLLMVCSGFYHVADCDVVVVSSKHINFYPNHGGLCMMTSHCSTPMQSHFPKLPQDSQLTIAAHFIL